MSDAFTTWELGVLDKISAPHSNNALNALYAWAQAESAPFDVMHINNPLNTTWTMPGATPWNTLGSGGHVWIYASIEDGIAATALTLLQPNFYPTILAHLRAGDPYTSWTGEACVELQRWGTGCGWTGKTFGPAPGALGVDDLTPQQEAWLVDVHSALGRVEKALGTAAGATDPNYVIPNYLGWTRDETSRETAILAALADLKAHPAAVADPSVLAIVQRIESALKQA